MGDASNRTQGERKPGTGDPNRTDRFVDQARLGKNDWWRYVAVLLILFGVLLLGPGIELGALLYPDVFSLDWTGEITGPVSFIFPVLNFATILIVLLLAVRLIHGRPAKTVITAYRRIRWGRILFALGLWAMLLAARNTVGYVLDPSSLGFSFDPARFFPLLFFVLLLLPVQTSTEEIFLRGYLLQWIGLRLRNVVALVLIGGVFFGLIHANPAFFVQTGGFGLELFLLFLNFFVSGAFYVWITLRDNGLELALGLHAAHNLFNTLVIGNPEDTLGSLPSLFVRTAEGAFGDAGVLLISNLSQLVMFALFAFVVFGLLGRRKERAKEVQ